MYFLVSHKRRLIVGWSAKSACSTLKYYFLKSEGEEIHEIPDIHVICKKYQPELRNSFINYRKFLFVRNPYTRLISFYLNRYFANNLKDKGLTTFTKLVNYLYESGFTFDEHHLELQNLQLLMKFLHLF